MYRCAFASFPNYLGNISLSLASLVAQRLKHLPPLRETRVWSLGWEEPLQKEMATHSSILAWRIPWMEKPGRLQSMGSQRVWHDWATSLSLFSLQLSFVFTLWPSFFLSLPPLNLFTSLSWRIQMNHQGAVWKGPKGRSFCALGTGVAHPPRMEMCSPTWEHQGCF